MQNPLANLDLTVVCSLAGGNGVWGEAVRSGRQVGTVEQPRSRGGDVVDGGGK